MKIITNSQHQSVQGPAEWFTGKVRIDMPFSQIEPATVSGASVTFESGARTAWHTHPLGQTLIVTAGYGWVQKLGEAKQAIKPGDIVIIAANEKHWHGASEHQFMTHIALQEAEDGQVVTWLEHVTDEQYQSQLLK